MAMCAVLALWPRALVVASQLLHQAFRGLGLLFFPVVWLLLLRLTLFERFPSTHALWGDWFNHALYLGMFTLGALFATANTQWERLAKWCWPALALAVGFWAVLVFFRPAKPAEHVVVAIYQWGALVAAFGFARVHLNHDSLLRQRLTEAVFPVYLLHQTVIIVASQWLLPASLVPAIEGPVLVFAAFAVSYAGYAMVGRISILRPWFGLKAVKV